MNNENMMRIVLIAFILLALTVVRLTPTFAQGLDPIVDLPPDFPIEDDPLTVPDSNTDTANLLIPTVPPVRTTATVTDPQTGPSSLVGFGVAALFSLEVLGLVIYIKKRRMYA